MVSERARQFMPFNALRGYYNLIGEQETEFVSKRELSEDEIEILSEKIMKVKKNDSVEIIYYDKGKYISCYGRVNKIDINFKFVKIGEKVIYFQEIMDINFK